MKQIIFKLFAPNIPLYDVMVGSVVDGCFKQDTAMVSWMSDNGVNDSSITYNPLLGTQAYLKNSDFLAFIRDNIDVICDAVMYPNFIVYTIKPEKDEESKKSEA